MRTDKDIRRIWRNVTPPNGKTMALLATMYKSIAANGMPVYIALRETADEPFSRST